MAKKALVMVSVVVGVTITAMAIPSSLDIDFRSSSSKSKSGKSLKFEDGFVNATARYDNPLTKKNENAVASVKQTVDGLGVDISDDPFFEDPNEVGTYEWLSIAFSGESGKGLEGVWLTKLFDETVDDAGYVDLYDTKNKKIKRISFVGQQTKSANPLGDVFVDFGYSGGVNLSKLVFSSEGSYLSGKDYSVAGIKVASIPDGGITVLLLGSVMIGLGSLSRRFLR